MPKRDSVKRLGDEVCAEYLGFTPTSNSTKLPYIANGLFREVSGEVCDYKDVHEWILSERKKGATSSEKIIEKYKDVLLYGENEDPSNIKQIRVLLGDIFNPDHTVYPSYKYSALNITSHWLVRGSTAAEAKIGNFIFEILSKTIDGNRSPAIELIQKALSVDTDDLTKLIKPIIVFPSEDIKRDIRGTDYPPDENIKWDKCKETIRNGFDNLSTNMEVLEESKNSLLVLERMVNYACFASFYYLANVNAVQHGGVPSPILIDAGEDVESIKKASEHCFSFAKTAVENYYIASIEDILNKEIPKDSVKECEIWMKNMVFSSDTREKDITSALKNYFDSFCADGDSPIHALSHALQIVLYTFDYKNNSPSDFCRVLGVRDGLIGPKGNRANKKRYLVNSFTLETITYSVLSDEDIKYGIELKDFSKKITEAYNILLGTDIDSEYKILEKANIAQNAPGDLRGDMALNAQRIADLFISLGLAHRYADGVTMIGGR